jgi:hypothetical protein
LQEIGPHIVNGEILYRRVHQRVRQGRVMRQAAAVMRCRFIT